MRPHWLPRLPLCARTFCVMSEERRPSASSYSAAGTAPARATGAVEEAMAARWVSWVEEEEAAEVGGERGTRAHKRGAGAGCSGGGGMVLLVVVRGIGRLADWWAYFFSYPAHRRRDHTSVTMKYCRGITSAYRGWLWRGGSFVSFLPNRDNGKIRFPYYPKNKIRFPGAEA